MNEIETMIIKDTLLRGANSEFDVTKDKDLRLLLENDNSLRTELMVSVFEGGKFITSRMANIILNKYEMKTYSGEIYYYKEGVYLPSGKDKIKEICALILGEAYKKHYANETISYIEGLTRVDELENTNANLLCLENGIYNIKENTLTNHNPTKIFLNKLPVKYDNNANCPNWLKFLGEVLDEDDIPNMQEFFGYCLWKEHHIHVAFLLYGEGSNGKSTLINTLKALLGERNCASIPLQRLCGDKFAIAQLHGKFVNLYSDLSKGAITDTGMFKMVTGQDMLPAERKFGQPFNFVNYSKQIFSCNEIPESRDDSPAFYRRWQIIMFNNVFEGANKDTKLLNKLTTEEELSGIFNWGLEGLKRLLEQGKLTNEKSTTIMKDLYIMKSNSVRAFVEKCCEQELETETPRQDLYLKYKDFCLLNNLPPVQDNTFGKKLQAIPDFNVIPTRPTFNGKRITCWKGISIKDAESSVGTPQVIRDFLA